MPTRSHAAVPAASWLAGLGARLTRSRAAVLAGLATLAAAPAGSVASGTAIDPLLSDGGLCGPVGAGRPMLLQALLAAASGAQPAGGGVAAGVVAGVAAGAASAPRPRTETTPFQPAPMKAAAGAVPLLGGLGRTGFRVARASPQVQAYFDQGLSLAFGFNHAEAQRAFQAAQKLDGDCGLCFWGEALVLGPNINVPMEAQAYAPAWAALQRAVALKDRLPPREKALIEALEVRYTAEAPPTRTELDTAYADAMKRVAARFPEDDLIQVLAAEAAMDTQPWDYWEAAGARPKGRTSDILAALETVLRRNPDHAGAIHLYIHAVEASTSPERALASARRLAALVPGAGHMVHMPSHIYYRVGLYRESLEANKRAIAADEAYFRRSPSDPTYRSAYYPHNIHFLMVSAQMGGDGPAAIAAAKKLDESLPDDLIRSYALMQPVKAAPYTTHAQFSPPETILKLAAPAEDLILVRVFHHYARALAQAALRNAGEARREIEAIAALEKEGDFKPFEAWNVPARAIAQTARLVATARLADAQGDLEGAALALQQAVTIEDELAYTEPPYWYYPVRQSLGAVRLRQGRLDEAEAALRESLARVRGNGWALAALVEVYRRKGDATAQAAARRALEKAWFGAAPPELSRI